MSPAPHRFCAHCGAPRTPGVGWCRSCHADDGDSGVTISKPVAATASPTTEAAPVPRRRGRLIVAAAAALVVVAGASYAVTDALTTDDAAQSAADAPATGAPGTPRTRRALEPAPSASPSSPSVATETPTATPTTPVVTEPPSPSPAATGDQQDLSCGSGYVVVLASDATGTPEQTVQTALTKYADAPDLHYLDPAQSCSNLSSMTDKTALGLVPYMGPFGDSVAACDARMDHLDTDTYVVGVDAGATSATYCACPYEDSAQPTLTPEQDAEPQGDNRFWVLELQYMLYDAGYNPDRLVPGTYGPLTTDMVEQIQIRGGLPVTGETDPRTWSAVEDFVC